MKHRMVNNGLGANTRIYLDNKGPINKAFADAALEFLKLDGADFHGDEDSISIGIEPTYQYQPLKIITISKKKADSIYITGTAWGPYGSRIAKKIRKRGDYKKQSQFTRFVDYWHFALFSNK